MDARVVANGSAAEALQDKLLQFLVHNPKEAFVFSGLDFWIFFGVFLFFFAISYKNIRTRNLVFLCFSLFFYYKSSGWAIFLLLFTLTEDFIIAHFVYRSSKRKIRLFLITLSVFSNLLVLSYFKYTFFFIDLFNSWLGTDVEKLNWLAWCIPQNDYLSFDLDHIILPVGISFFTFQSLSYTIDVYRGEIKPLRSWLDFAFFASFFPQLVAGPIVRAKDFVGQIFAEYQVSKQVFGKGVFLILSGLFKKVVISDVISTQLVDRVFDQARLVSPLESWLGFYGYGVQIFCDFSGYTDIAIGLALILGFRLNPNFDQPYKSVSITEFWRRWHISLSVWLRDYLYIPLGGSRRGTFRTYFNLLTTMLLGGLWHGAHLKFLLWGGMHGAALVVHKLWSALAQKWHIQLPNPVAWFLTFHFALLCWLPFRAADLETVSILLQRMLTPWDMALVLPVLSQYMLPTVLIGFGLFLHFLPDNFKARIIGIFEGAGLIWLGFFSIVAILVIYQFKTAESQPFIYFQF